MANNSNKIGVVGTGVIGNGWIARFLAKGYNVVAFDPAEGAEGNTRRLMERIWPTLEDMGVAQEASMDKLKFVNTIKETVEDAAYVQENVPERENLKKEVLQEIDEHLKPEGIIGSSTSGITATTLQEGLRNPERLIVAHPFNPVYILPLVEVVGGEKTKKTVIEQAKALFTEVDMKPLVIHQEIEGHVADRLMEALWREALHIVNDGVATTDEVDRAITYGAGLRWALMGPFMTFHMAGGDAGMRHMLDQFGPALKLPWTKLVAPELTEDLKERVIEGCESSGQGKTVAELEEKRNEFLVKQLELVSDYWPLFNKTE
ncbi:3-hydroxyacyl-CoA dehydrogenase NAD-binding domain-containing protein [Isachenkonia alkalipeptolytica]|uniref:L-carnitine dehydrogenase n=1 Tax=Isachenkonia alkalipeptolytica TaxID=2565777 RepID=A0AA43XLI4_9CLOT|nr:3-hydroxyacyl-CoA dehydrogenase NAD-binding domain-containing protein [Isachenkonia alkalipeptolytica]NBG88449.1 L-carnitine dehydrogenase [Isachenkonia alkalipeptolytica]